jgi:hypothetical protein
MNKRENLGSHSVRIVSKPELRHRKKGKKLKDEEGNRELQGRTGFSPHELSLGSLHSHSLPGLVRQPTFVFVMIVKLGDILLYLNISSRCKKLCNYR